MRGNFFAVFKTVWFWAPFLAWLVAQTIKMIGGFLRTRRLDLHYLVSTGGMPSAHSAMASGLATCTGVTVGFDTPLFVVTLAFALVTMFDAATVRHAAGMQAHLLNEIIDQLAKGHTLPEQKQKLVEFLGHTRLEVMMGMIVGILVALLVVSSPQVFPAFAGK